MKLLDILLYPLDLVAQILIRDHNIRYRFCPSCGKSFKWFHLSTMGTQRHECKCGVVSWHPSGLKDEDFEPPRVKQNLYYHEEKK